MGQLQIERELLSFDEKIALAKLEESKASERVRELEYQKSRYRLEICALMMKAEQEKQKCPAT